MSSNLSRTASALIAAAAVAAVLTVLPGTSEPVSASAPLTAGKADRLDIRTADVRCTTQAWPHIDAACLKDSRQPASQARPVRVISLDRAGR